MPFAGRYTLTGKNSKLNRFRGEPELEVAYEYLTRNLISQKSKCIVLNHDCYFDISLGTQSQPFIPVNFHEKNEHVKKSFFKN